MNFRVGGPEPSEGTDVREVLKGMGIEVDPTDAHFLQGVADQQAEIERNFADDPSALVKFRANPVQYLSERYPDLSPANRHGATMPVAIGHLTLFDVEPPTPAEELLGKITEWVSQSESNGTRFRAEPYVVLNEQSAGYSQQIVNKVSQALDTVLGVTHVTTLLELVEASRNGRI